METIILPAFGYKDEIAALFKEYTDMLIEGEPKFIEYLGIQNYDEEVKHLEHKYGLPDGRLYIVFCGGAPAGCIGLRKLDEESCEMKRLYVKPKFRGNGIATKLVSLILSEAKEIGYRYMYLDTLPFLETAISMYKKIGFREIPCYNDSPIENTVYMRLDLHTV